MAEVLSPLALCNVEDVVGPVGLVKVDAPSAEELEQATRLVNAASSTIYDLTGREYVSSGDAETRIFEADFYDFDFGPELELGAMSDLDGVTLVRRDGTQEAVTFSNLILLPFGRKPSEPITSVRIVPASTVRPRAGDQSVRVTGVFGYPERPERVRQAAAITAAAWYSRDVSRYSELFVQEAGARPGPRALPPEAYDLIRSDLPPHLG